MLELSNQVAAECIRAIVGWNVDGRRNYDLLVDADCASNSIATIKQRQNIWSSDINDILPELREVDSACDDSAGRLEVESAGSCRAMTDVVDDEEIILVEAKESVKQAVFQRSFVVGAILKMQLLDVVLI